MSERPRSNRNERLRNETVSFLRELKRRLPQASREHADELIEEASRRLDELKKALAEEEEER